MVVLRTDFIKTVVVGDDNVGKTSMLMNYATNRFPFQHVPRVFDNYAGFISLSGRHYNLQLIDTMDEGSSAECRRHLYPGTDVFVVCFSIVNPESFRNIREKWVPEIQSLMGDTPFILVGTHADLRDDDTTTRALATAGKKAVSMKEGVALSRRLGAACYIEFSPIMKKRVRHVINEALGTVFCPKGVGGGDTGCTIL